MNHPLRLVFGAVLLASGTSQLNAQSAADTSGVLSTVQRFFDGMAQRDTAAIRATLLPGTRFVSLAVGEGSGQTRAQSDTSFMRMLATRPQHLLERMWSPVVNINGPLATVWTPYDFHIDGKWSHCGIDAFTLMRTAGAWIIVELAYTVQRAGCPPSPLGDPPRK